MNGDFVLSVLSQGGQRKKRSLGDGVNRNYDEFKERRTKKGDTNLTEGKSSFARVKYKRMCSSSSIGGGGLKRS